MEGVNACAMCLQICMIMGTVALLQLWNTIATTRKWKISVGTVFVMKIILDILDLKVKEYIFSKPFLQCKCVQDSPMEHGVNLQLFWVRFVNVIGTPHNLIVRKHYGAMEIQESLQLFYYWSFPTMYFWLPALLQSYKSLGVFCCQWSDFSRPFSSRFDLSNLQLDSLYFCLFPFYSKQVCPMLDWTAQNWTKRNTKLWNQHQQ